MKYYLVTFTDKETGIVKAEALVERPDGDTRPMSSLGLEAFDNMAADGKKLPPPFKTVWSFEQV